MRSTQSLTRGSPLVCMMEVKEKRREEKESEEIEEIEEGEYRGRGRASRGRESIEGEGEYRGRGRGIRGISLVILSMKFEICNAPSDSI